MSWNSRYRVLDHSLSSALFVQKVIEHISSTIYMNYNEFNALKQNITQFSYQTKLYLSFEFLSSCNQRIIVHVPIQSNVYPRQSNKTDGGDFRQMENGQNPNCDWQFRRCVIGAICQISLIRSCFAATIRWLVDPSTHDDGGTMMATSMQNRMENLPLLGQAEVCCWGWLNFPRAEKLHCEKLGTQYGNLFEVVADV